MSKPFDIIVRNRWSTTHNSLSRVPSAWQVLSERLSRRKLVQNMQASACCHKCGKAEHNKGFMPKYLSTGIKGVTRFSQCEMRLLIYILVSPLSFMEDQSLLAPLQTPQCILLVFEPGQGMKLIYLRWTEHILKLFSLPLCLHAVREKKESEYFKRIKINTDYLKICRKWNDLPNESCFGCVVLIIKYYFAFTFSNL